MKKMIAHRLQAVLVSALLLAPVFTMANPMEDMISLYNQAAAGDEAKVDTVYQQLESHIEAEGAKPLTLAYLGSVETLKGRDAWMPWNAMKYVEQGLAKIEKGLNLLAANPIPLKEQQILQGLPESYLTQVISASTYTQLPDMFNRFERGYDIYLSLLAQPGFSHARFEATAWVYAYAIQAAIRAEDLPQAKTWLAVMELNDANHPQTLKASAFINNA